MPMRASLATSLAVLALLLSGAPARVRAGGYELLPGGTQAVARGGAIAARPDNAMLLEQNPAGLALLSGQQLLLNVDVPVQDMCVDPYGYYGWGVYQPGSSDFGDQLGSAYARTPLPKVCNSAQLFGIPHLAWAGKLTDDFALAAGFVAPTLVTGMQYGGADGTIAVPGSDNGAPTPTRYQVIRQQLNFALAPSLGFGYRVARWLQLGASSQITMVRATTRAVQNATSGTQPSTDWLVDVDAHDYFIPSLTVAANFTPTRALDLMVAFHWSDKFDGSGKVTYETNTFHQLDGTNVRNLPINLPLVQVGFPWTLTAGARYAGLLPVPDISKETRPSLRDPMDRELWDVELDATYSFNSLASKNIVQPGQDVTVVTRQLGSPSTYATVKAKDLSKIALERHTLDSIVVRAGGSYSVIPRALALEAGAFFETRGLDPAYASVDVFAFQRIGMGFGLMARTGDFDLLAAYGHIFQETVEVAPPPHQRVEQANRSDPSSGFDQRVGGTFGADGTRMGGSVLGDPSAPSVANADAVARAQASSAAPSPARPDRVINAGRYTASFNIISVGAVYHF